MSNPQPTFTIVPREQRQREDTIDLLKSYLKAAEDGEITTVGIVAITSSGPGRFAFSHTHNHMALIGASRMLTRMLEDEVVATWEQNDTDDIEPSEDE